MVTWCLVTLLGVGLLLGGGVGAAPLVTTSWGSLAGVDWTSPSGGGYSAYLAVPFALPPVGPLRFQKPQSHPGISIVHNATQFGPICMQLNSVPGLVDISHVSEDCLTLNVFVPSDQNTKPASGWPVMVWIHGGGYVLGSAREYDPWRLVVDNNVIVVTVQYRLGPFGFLATGDGLLPGNLGLWDQTMAIKWVKDNIAAFGGDSSTITIFGESAGSGSVTAQLLSPHTSGLFKRVIGQSGAVTALWSSNKFPLNGTLGLALRLGCLASRDQYPGQRDAMVACLQGKDAAEILNGAFQGSNLWVPTNDGDFFPKDTSEMISDGALLQSIGFFDRDLMMGVNNNEGVVMLTSISAQQATNATFYRSYYDNFLESYYAVSSPDIIDLLEYEFTYPRDPRNPDKISLQGFLDTTRELFFTAPSVGYTRAHAQKPSGSGRTYLYYFNYFPASAPYGGMAHGQDVSLLFPPSAQSQNSTGNPLNLATSLDSNDLQMARIFATMLADFARTGDPNPALTGNLPAAILWPEFDPMEEQYLDLDLSSTVEKHLLAKRVSMYWDILPKMQQRWQARSNGSCETKPIRLSRFDLDVDQAEILIIALIAASSLFLLLLLVATYCACSQGTTARASKYKA